MNLKQVDKISEITGLNLAVRDDSLYIKREKRAGFEYLGEVNQIKTLLQFINVLPSTVDVDTIYVLLRNEKILPVLSEQELVIRKLRKLGYKKVKADYGCVKAYYSHVASNRFYKSNYQRILNEKEIEYEDVYNLLLSIQKKNRGDCYY